MSKEIANVSLDQMGQMAMAIAESGLFGVSNPKQALALMIVAQAEGRHPGSVANEYHIIQGRAALKSDVMLARFLEAGGKIRWSKSTDAICEADFSHPSTGDLSISWDLERAKTAGLMGNPTWKKYPRQMLRARVITEGVRAMYPGVTRGMYGPEEIRDGGADEVAAEISESDDLVTLEKPADAPAEEQEKPKNGKLTPKEGFEKIRKRLDPDTADEIIFNYCADKQTALRDFQDDDFMAVGKSLKEAIKK